MPFVLLPGRNPIIKAAWAGLRADERKAQKAERAEKTAAAGPAKKKPAKKPKAAKK